MSDDKVYADGSLATGDPFDVDRTRAAELTHAYAAHVRRERRKVPANPPAATVHKLEEHRPWRRAPAEEIAAENERARVELQAKRVTNLATQACRGMLKNYGIPYEMTSLRNILVDAYKEKEGKVGPGHLCAAATARARRWHGEAMPSHALRTTCTTPLLPYHPDFHRH